LGKDVGENGREAKGDFVLRLFMFFLFFCSSPQAREAAKSGTMLFHEAMCFFGFEDHQESIKRFEPAAEKGHEESIWILNVAKDMESNQSDWEEGFAKTETPLGWYFAGRLSDGREKFDFYKKSAEGGCSWGQVEYGWVLQSQESFGELDGEAAYLKWLKKAAKQNNPEALEKLGGFYKEEGRQEKARRYLEAAAAMGWNRAPEILAQMLRKGAGGGKDLRRAALLSAAGGFYNLFWDILGDCLCAIEEKRSSDLGCDFNRLCYSLGWGLYWNVYGSTSWRTQYDAIQKAFANLCLGYYCTCVELQQKSIFIFLLHWNQTSGGVKDVGVMIARMVWEQREDQCVVSVSETALPMRLQMKE
jgi:tetratricopeptide (TPR) repeat protein